MFGRRCPWEHWCVLAGQYTQAQTDGCNFALPVLPGGWTPASSPQDAVQWPLCSMEAQQRPPPSPAPIVVGADYPKASKRITEVHMLRFTKPKAQQGAGSLFWVKLDHPSSLPVSWVPAASVWWHWVSRRGPPCCFCKPCCTHTPFHRTNTSADLLPQQCW